MQFILRLAAALEQLQMFVLSLFLMRGWRGFAYFAKQALAENSWSLK